MTKRVTVKKAFGNVDKQGIEVCRLRFKDKQKNEGYSKYFNEISAGSIWWVGIVFGLMGCSRVYVDLRSIDGTWGWFFALAGCGSLVVLALMMFGVKKRVLGSSDWNSSIAGVSLLITLLCGYWLPRVAYIGTDIQLGLSGSCIVLCIFVYSYYLQPLSPFWVILDGIVCQLVWTLAERLMAHSDTGIFEDAPLQNNFSMLATSACMLLNYYQVNLIRMIYFSLKKKDDLGKFKGIRMRLKAFWKETMDTLETSDFKKNENFRTISNHLTSINLMCQICRHLITINWYLKKIHANYPALAYYATWGYNSLSIPAFISIAYQLHLKRKQKTATMRNFNHILIWLVLIQSMINLIFHLFPNPTREETRLIATLMGQEFISLIGFHNAPLPILLSLITMQFISYCTFTYQSSLIINRERLTYLSICLTYLLISFLATMKLARDFKVMMQFGVEVKTKELKMNRVTSSSVDCLGKTPETPRLALLNDKYRQSVNSVATAKVTSQKLLVELKNEQIVNNDGSIQSVFSDVSKVATPLTPRLQIARK